MKSFQFQPKVQQKFLRQLKLNSRLELKEVIEETFVMNSTSQLRESLN